MSQVDRRQFLKLAGIGGVAFASGLGFDAYAANKHNAKTVAALDFYFVQLSDTHWGFNGAAVNPEATNTLTKAITAVNNLEQQPDFVIFTGDLTHSTDDPNERRRRMAEFKAISETLKVKNVKFLPGEHDAALDKGEAYQEFFGSLHYSFDHKGIHFIVLDNVSNPELNLGEAQLNWLKADLQHHKRHAPIVIFTHRPLFDLYQQWDWFTRDGQAAIDLLMPFKNVAVFYGHIHQVHQHETGHIQHYAAQSLIFPLPAPGSVPKRAPIPWNAAMPYQGLGYKNVEAYPKSKRYEIEDIPLVSGEAL
ncbi:MAG: metallophosphoesterase [Methylococcaceae bacterium]|jgi:predicted MPP superfamily phosphohydrolase